MVGGRAPGLRDEILFRCEFPERPGVLSKFVNGISSDDWSITLFHYRNHGADYGRVLAGLHVPPGDRDRFVQRMAALGYPWQEETTNPAYRMFLGG